METIYLDELFLLDLVVDYFLLLGTAKVCALPYQRRRFLAGAALGAAWNCLGLLPGLGWLICPAMRPVLGLAMTLIAFGGERRLWRCYGYFLGLSALFGGTVYAACLFRGGSALHLDMRVLVLAFAVCWAGISFLYRGVGRAAPRRLRQVTVERRGRQVSLRALEDTGNGLVDPITGCAAFVAEAEAVRGLFSPADAAYLRAPPTEAALHIPGARLIPYAGVEGKSGLLLAFRPDKVTVDGRERRDLIAAVSPGRLGPDGSYDAVL